MLASIQRIVSVEKHPNADALDIVQVKGYKAIVKRDQWQPGALCVFIEPDSILPDVPWAAFYKAKSSRVRAIKLRGSWSFGVVESLDIIGPSSAQRIEEGADVTELLGVTKYVIPEPQDLNASGGYGNGIPRTDEERYQSLNHVPYGELCDVTLKIDGQSLSAIFSLYINREINSPDEVPTSEVTRAIGGRSFLYKPESDNNYTRNARQYDVLAKLEAFCLARGINLCIRGESYGNGIQKGAHNPHSKLPLSLALYSTWLIDERRYARKGDPYYIFDIAPKLGLPTVPMLEKDVPLTRELIAKYAEGLTEVNGQPFEGVVINWAGGSFKIINLSYDSKK